LSPEALDAADVRVRVPLWGFTESFNVSVCAALVLQDTVRRLRAGGAAWALTPAEQQALRLEWYRRSIRQVQLIEERFRERFRRTDTGSPKQGQR
jgi:tRNA (guanosine-2'-O-)-methyltransferase